MMQKLKETKKHIIIAINKIDILDDDYEFNKIKKNNNKKKNNKKSNSSNNNNDDDDKNKIDTSNSIINDINTIYGLDVMAKINVEGNYHYSIY
jgi:GTPase Era involved in 16S rRNA processing